MSNWQTAFSYCEGLSWGGHSDWHLPSVSELQSLVDNRRTFAPFIDTAAFPATPNDRFWSSSSRAAYTVGAWYVDFLSGYVNSNGDKALNLHARCVRGGP